MITILTNLFENIIFKLLSNIQNLFILDAFNIHTMKKKYIITNLSQTLRK